MDVLMGMKDAEGMLITSPIVAEDEIKLITSLPLPGNGGDGIMGFFICGCQDPYGRIVILPPSLQEFICRIEERSRLILPFFKNISEHGLNTIRITQMMIGMVAMVTPDIT